MRLRFLWIDYYQEASEEAQARLQRSVLPIPSLQESVFSSFPCKVLVSAQTISQLLEGKSHMVNTDPSILHNLDIQRVQSQFLSTILPEKVNCSWKNPWLTLPTDELFIERLLLLQEGIREAQLIQCFHEFESLSMDMSYQNNTAMMSLSELLSIARRRSMEEVRHWQDQSPPEWGKFSSVEDMVLQLEKKSDEIQDNLYDNKKIDIHTSVKFDRSDSFCEDVKADLPYQRTPNPNLLFLEVAAIDETVCASWNYECFWMEIKRLSMKLFLNAYKMPISNEEILEPHWMNLALNENLEPFCDDINKIQVESAQDCDDSMWNLLDNKISDENNHFPMFELPVTFCEDNRSEDFVALFKHLSLSQQCIPVLELSDPNCDALYEDLIVMPELVLTDFNFTSLPVPKFIEKTNNGIATDVVLEALLMCKHSVPGALNFLYLDWHFSQGKDCRKDSCNVLESRVIEIERCEIAHYKSSGFDNVNLDTAFDIHMEKNYLLVKEPLVASPKRDGITGSIQTEIPVSTTKNNCSVGTKCSIHKEAPFSTTKENHGLGIECCEQREPWVYTPKQNCSLDSSESVCPLPSSTESNLCGKLCKTNELPSKSMNHMHNKTSCKVAIVGDIFGCNDLMFFLQARQGTIKTPICPGNTLQKENLDIDQISITECLPKFQVHRICLTQKIMSLRGFLELDYFRILEDDENLAFQLQKHKFLMNLSTENNAKKTLLMLIKERADKQEFLNEQQLLRGLIALYILQQTAENLCIYGILVGHLYMECWYLNLRFLQDLICLSYSELEEAYKQVEKGALVDHPKLSFFQEIIERHKSILKSPKFLIVVERRAVFTIYKQIIACDLRPYQFDREENLLHGGIPLEDQDLINQAVPDALVKCDCLIVPPEYLTSWFPIQQFSCIIHYDDFTANEESSLWNTSSRYNVEIHAFQITLEEDDSKTQAGVHIACSQKGSHLSESGTISQENLGECSIKLPNGPKVNTYSTSSIQNSSESEKLHLDTSNYSVPGDTIFTGIQLNGYKQCDMNIIVNTNQSYKHLLSCYRSSYDKILVLEKDGVCVIERDLFLPIDLILSPTLCLILYTQDKVYEYKTMSNAIIQPSWVEDITNDIMKALSFSFTNCIMIFEGTFKFIEEVIQAFSNLYAAAVGLDIRLQCFISGGTSTTDFIISGCINQVRRSKKQTPFPSMREAKTYAEAFLTEFASINPLTAHAILSSGIGIRRFMSLSVEEQIHLTDAFGLGEKSLHLLKKQWQYSGRSGNCFRESKLTRYERNGMSVPGAPKGLGDQVSEEQFEMRNFVDPNTGTGHLFVEDFSLSKNDLVDDLGEEWEFQKPHQKCEANFLANECDLWPSMAREYPNESEGNFRNHRPNMIHLNKETMRSMLLPGHEHRTVPASAEHETRLKRTVDLILKRAPKSEKASGIRNCFSSLCANKSSLKVQHHLASLSPELEVENVHRNTSLLKSNSVPSLDEDGKINSQDLAWHMFPVPTDSRDHWVDDIREKPESIFLSQSVRRKAIGRDVRQCKLVNECSIRQSSKECLEELANERTPSKRMLEFDLPATVKKHQRGGHPTKGKEDLKLGFFDKYCYEGENREKFGSGGIMGSNIKKKIAKKAPTKRSKMSSFDNSHGWGSQYRKSQICYSQPMQEQHDEEDDMAQTREHCLSWTPHDKRSKKVLSFVKRGNDGQSRLIWQSFHERGH